MASIVKEKAQQSLTLSTLYIDAERLDVSNADEVYEALQAELAGEVGAIIELGKVAFIDSAGLAALVRALDLANPDQSWSKRCALSSPAPAVKHVLELVGLSQCIAIYDSTGIAQREFKPQS